MSTDTVTEVTEVTEKPAKAPRKRNPPKAKVTESPKAEVTEQPEIEAIPENPTNDQIAALLGIQERGSVGRPVTEETKKVHAELDNVREIAGNTFASVLYANVGIPATDKGKQKMYRAVNSWINKRAEIGENWGIDRKISGKDGYALRLIPTEN